MVSDFKKQFHSEMTLGTVQAPVVYIHLANDK